MRVWMYTVGCRVVREKVGVQSLDGSMAMFWVMARQVEHLYRVVVRGGGLYHK